MNLTTYTKHESLALNSEIEPGALQSQIQNSDITIAIDGIIGHGDGYYDIIFRDVLPNESLLDSVIAAHDGSPISVVEEVKLSEAHDELGRLIMVPEKRLGTGLDICTHNFSDPTTWFGESVRVLGSEPELIPGTDGKKYKLDHEMIIDMVHGKVLNEDNWAHDYICKVYADGYEVCEFTPFEASYDNCEYSVEYEDGYIDFFDDMSGNSITVDYSYANGSGWFLIPSAGKSIQIERSEVQFSDDLIYNDAIDFEVWGYNPADLPNKIRYEHTSYKSMCNFIDEAVGSYPIIPAVGGPDLGNVTGTLGFPFNYNTVRALKSSQGAELRIRLRNDRKFGGERATATFYCTIRDE